ncbi:MAG TPA: aminoglycoside 6-adenylyltransferase [Thermomicrobiaceae bacterium]|nr:aminoglycoside 6-adenylyltransferase [Thermomicrobiaceae bacterium]
MPVHLTLSVEAYHALGERIRSWASAEPSVRAALVVGSRARSDHPADAWADLDIVLMVTDPRPYLASGDWLDRFGTVLFRSRYATVGSIPEWLVTYAGGLDADFVFAPAPGGGQESDVEVRDRTAAQMFARGFIVLVDKDGWADHLRASSAATPTPRPPTPMQFAELCESFWCAAERVAKKVGRGEIHVALIWLTELHERGVLPMLEWHERGLHGGGYDTWHAGRFLEEWGDPRVQEALPQALPGYGRGEVARGVLATIELFHWVAVETAESFGYADPSARDARAMSLIRALLGVDNARPAAK